MALDGIFLRYLAKELETQACGAKVNQIQQPSREELVLLLHTKEGNRRLLISAKADAPRMGFTSRSIENPPTPPMFCMLLRKHLSGARLVAVRQHQLERLLFLHFDALNTVGDRQELILAVEIMGKHSNCILLDEGGIIIDALKRVDMTLSSKRMVLPQLRYELPPAQGKLSVLEADAEYIVKRALEYEYKTLDKALLETLQGASPIVCRELAFRATGGTDTPVAEITEEQKKNLIREIEIFRENIEGISGTPTLIRNTEGKPFDLSFSDILQYGGAFQKEHFDSFCTLLDEYYLSRDTMERMKAHSRDLTKLVTNGIQRLTRKINVQMQELESTKDREILRIKADLLQANLYRIEKGATFVDVENFYDENMANIRIDLNPAKSPAQNAQKYYKDYARAKTADKMLRVQIGKAEQELQYLESVYDEIQRADSQKELSLIRHELEECGYIKAQKKKNKAPQELPPKEYRTSDGFTVLIGRNNRQNDYLTMKASHKEDMWLHTKDIPGSHTIIRSEGREISDTAIFEAAQFCAFNSKARESSQVPVDFTKIRYVSKPQGAPFGKVIYINQRTIYVTPVNPEE